MKILVQGILVIVATGSFGCSEKTSRVSDNKFQPAGVELSPSISKPDSVSAVINSGLPESDSVAGKTKSNPQQVNRFIVSFYSIGAGIEQKQMEKFENFLIQYRQKTSKNIPAEKTHWGREGEVDFCCDLSELSPAGQKTFIREVKEELKTAVRANYSENSPCKKQRR